MIFAWESCADSRDAKNLSFIISAFWAYFAIFRHFERDEWQKCVFLIEKRERRIIDILSILFVLVLRVCKNNAKNKFLQAGGQKNRVNSGVSAAFILRQKHQKYLCLSMWKSATMLQNTVHVCSQKRKCFQTYFYTSLHNLGLWSAHWRIDREQCVTLVLCSRCRRVCWGAVWIRPHVLCPKSCI